MRAAANHLPFFLSRLEASHLLAYPDCTDRQGISLRVEVGQ